MADEMEQRKRNPGKWITREDLLRKVRESIDRS
jgi:hypothetical protein